MADVNINGLEITFDLERITMSELRRYVKGKLSDDGDDEILARVCGQSVEWVRELSPTNYKRLSGKFIKIAFAPLDDPN